MRPIVQSNPAEAERPGEKLNPDNPSGTAHMKSPTAIPKTYVGFRRNPSRSPTARMNSPPAMPYVKAEA